MSKAKENEPVKCTKCRELLHPFEFDKIVTTKDGKKFGVCLDCKLEMNKGNKIKQLELIEQNQLRGEGEQLIIHKLPPEPGPPNGRRAVEIEYTDPAEFETPGGWIHANEQTLLQHAIYTLDSLQEICSSLMLFYRANGDYCAVHDRLFVATKFLMKEQSYLEKQLQKRFKK